MPRRTDTLKHFMNVVFRSTVPMAFKSLIVRGSRSTANRKLQTAADPLAARRSPLADCRLPIAYCLLFLLLGCANIVPPSGGPKDERPPMLVRVSPADSQLHTRVKKLELEFDEYITLADQSAQVQISPLLSIPLTVTSKDRKVTVTIPDSLLEDETTYRLTFGTAIRDLHEGNIFQLGGYTFSTGSYFDSLALAGDVIDGSTGLPDTASFVMLYPFAAGDSAVVRRKPSYVTHVDAAGHFKFLGLPSRRFRVYALRDANANLTFDGGKEWIGFIDSVIRPGDTSMAPIRLHTFQEAGGDTAVVASTDDNSRGGGGFSRAARGDKGLSIDKPLPGSYRVLADTNDIRRRTQSIAKPLEIRFGRRLSAALNTEKMFLSVDSAGVSVEESYRLEGDSTGLNYKLIFRWREDAVYTLRLQKGFAKDSAGTDLLPGRFTFRTRRDEDYGKLSIHLPSRFYGPGFLFQLRREGDTVYDEPVRDTLLNFPRLEAGNYSMRVIADSNRNGVWDPGDLFLRRQPETVIPYMQPILLKAGWEQQIDFDDPKRRR